MPADVDIYIYNQGWIQDFLRWGLNTSDAGGHSPPEAIRFFVIITPKSYLMQDLEHI